VQKREPFILEGVLDLEVRVPHAKRGTPDISRLAAACAKFWKCPQCWDSPVCWAAGSIDACGLYSVFISLGLV